MIPDTIADPPCAIVKGCHNPPARGRLTQCAGREQSGSQDHKCNIMNVMPDITSKAQHMSIKNSP
jgi:hypothetical protein